jgi:hypothetical protein
MLQRKLRIKEDQKIVLLNAPSGFRELLHPLPPGTTLSSKLSKQNNFIMLFVKNKSELESLIFKASESLVPDGLLWTCYPKGSSGMQTDLTRDKGWECLEKIRMQWLALISLDESWSAFLMRNSEPKAQSSSSKDYHRNKELIADPKTKTVTVPADLQKQFEKNKKAADFFKTLNFTGRKEYVMWIVAAKRDETRKERIKKTILKLTEGKKNPTEK